MDKIVLKDVRLYGYHGCMDEEGKIGSEYRVDLEVRSDLTKSGQTDNLTDTVDYVSLHNIIKKEMKERSKLLETVAARILNTAMAKHKNVAHAVVRVYKINPPIGGDVGSVHVELEKSRGETA